MEVQCVEQLQPEHLHVTLLAWLGLGDYTAALSAFTRHTTLAAGWSREQQRLAFKSASTALNRTPKSHAALRVAQRVWVIRVSNNLPDRQAQLHDLLGLLLSKKRLPDAHEVSIYLY